MMMLMVMVLPMRGRVLVMMMVVLLMPFVMRMFVMEMFVLRVMVLMPVRPMLVVLPLILLMGMRRPFVDGKFHPLDVLARLPLPMSVEIANVEFAQFPLERGRFHPQVAQGADGHIAADAGETIEIEHTHKGALFHCPAHFPSAHAEGRREGVQDIKGTTKSCR
jgi:hypothetical protein